MRKKIITAISLFFVFSLLFSAQFTQTAQALEPITSPVTNPVTGPITGPITGPSSFFTISGKVTYHLLGLFRRGAERFMPAPGVLVKAVDVFSQHTATATTDANGNYTITPGKSGLYKVSASGGEASFYVPPIQFVNDNKPAGKKNVNFQGVLFKF